MGKNGTYCRINGTVHNLAKIQDILDGKSTENMGLILMEEHGMSAIEANCFETVLKRFCNNEIPADYNEALQRFREYNENNRSPRAYQPPKVKCPRCGSTDIRKVAYGVAINSCWEYRNRCNNCGETWRK